MFFPHPDCRGLVLVLILLSESSINPSIVQPSHDVSSHLFVLGHQAVRGHFQLVVLLADALCCSRWCSNWWHIMMPCVVQDNAQNWWQFITKVALSVRNSDLLFPEEPSLVSRSPGHRPLWRWSPESVFQLINPSVGPKSKVFEWMNYWCVVVFHLSALEIVSSSDLLGQTTVFSLEATNLQGSSTFFVIFQILTPSSSPPPSYCLVDVTSQPIVEMLKTLLLFSSWKLRTALAIWHFRIRVVLQPCQIWWTMFLKFQWPTQFWPIELINNSMCMVSAIRSPSLWRLREDLVDSAPIEHYCDGPKNQNDQQHC